MRMLIMGPPGAGKGTQATAIADRYQIPAISTGQMFRAHIAAQDELGMEISRIIAAGEYVDDEITNAVVDARLHEEDAQNGFLLDGYPRTLAQVAALDEILAADFHGKLDVVLSLVADPDELVGRLLKRAEIEGRADDNEDTIRRRMEVYAGQTAPLLFHYENKRLLVEVEGTGTVEEVRQRMFELVDARVEA